MDHEEIEQCTSFERVGLFNVPFLASLFLSLHTQKQNLFSILLPINRDTKAISRGVLFFIQSDLRERRVQEEDIALS